ncbi:hypothetical protein F5880DRAFT_1541449, partial [Lentinula raphanica]
VTVSPSRLNFTIGTVTMSQETRAELGRDMRAAVDDYRVDKLPNVPSIYQFAVLLRRQLDKVKYRGTVTVHSFNISDSSEFGKAFDEMVRKKGTGAGDELSEEEDKWEWELYKRIQNRWEWELYKRIESKAIILENSLWLHHNHDIFEELWDEIHGLLPAQLAPAEQDIWDHLDHFDNSVKSSGHDEDIRPIVIQNWIRERDDEEGARLAPQISY